MILQDCNRSARLGLSFAVLASVACLHSYDTGFGAPKADVRPDGPPVDPDVSIFTAGPIGWASVDDGLGQTGTTGGGDTAPVTVNTIEELTAAAIGTTPAVIQIAASMVGRLRVGSNKTIEGLPGVVFTGHIGFSGSVNAILRNLKIVGFNCTDSPTDCSAGDDAVTIDNRSHHIWVDHCDISDGSDGNLDIVGASDYVTVSWTKFWYTGRPGDHQFSNLIGSSDRDTGDAGHLHVTFHHDWWADKVAERMPRARFGQVHLFNNLYTTIGDLYCVGVGFRVNILLESNVFSGVRVPVDIHRFEMPVTPTNVRVAVSWGNLYLGSNADDLGTEADVFDPLASYAYSLEPAANVEKTVRQFVGPPPP